MTDLEIWKRVVGDMKAASSVSAYIFD